MTIRLLAHVPRDAKPIMELLLEYAKGELELVFSLGDKDADIKASSLSKMSSQLGKSGHLMSGTAFTGMRHSVVSSPSYFEDMERFIVKWSCFLGQGCGLSKMYQFSVHATFRISTWAKYAASGVLLSSAV